MMWMMHRHPVIHLVHNVKQIFQCDKELAASPNPEHRAKIIASLKAYAEEAASALNRINAAADSGYKSTHHKCLFVELQNVNSDSVSE